MKIMFLILWSAQQLINKDGRNEGQIRPKKLKICSVGHFFRKGCEREASYF